MPKEQLLNDFIYQYFRFGLDLGIYKCGSYLRPIQQYCDFFDVAPLTVRLTFQKLEREGYLSLSRGRPARVVKSGPHPPLAEPPYSRGAIADLNRTMMLLNPPIFAQGLWAEKEENLEQLEYICRQEDVAYIQEFSGLYISLLKALGNPLYFYLFIDFLLYSKHEISRGVRRERMWGPQEVSLLCGQLQKLMAARRANHPEVAMDIFHYLYHIPAALEEAGPGDQDEGEGYAPFQWEPYKGRANYSYPIANNLLHQIWRGKIPPGQPLPPVAELARRYEVSIKTVRQALHQLGKAGVVETRNGVGSFVCQREGWVQHIDWQDPTVQKHMASYFHAMQFTVVVIREIARHSFPKVPPEAFAAVVSKIEQEPVGNLYPASSECLRLLIDYSGLKALQEIYSHLAQILIWGVFYPPQEAAPLAQWQETTGQIISAIKAGDGERFACQLQRLYHSYFMYDRATAVRLGIQGVEDIAVPKLL